MKLLNRSFTQIFFVKFSARHLLNSVALSAGILLSAAHVNAQNDKRISYPVTIPIERVTSSSSSPVSSSAAVAVYKAPEPVIREIEEASSTPPPARKAVSKKSITAKSDKKKSVADRPKKTVVKTVTTVTKTTAAKKSSVTKSPAVIPKAISKESATTIKNAESINKNADVLKATIPLVASANAATIEDVNGEIARSQNLIQTSSSSATTEPSVQGMRMDDEEAQLDSSLSETISAEPQYTGPVTKTTTTTTVTTVNAGTATTLKNLPLPVSNQREKFVTEFLEFVEKRVAPTVPGLAVAVISDGKVKVLQTYGVKRVGNKDPVNADTVFRLASVSKGFGSAAAAMVVQDNLLSWDTPVTSILPDVEFSNPRYGNQLTVRNILSHSTGLPTQANTNFIEEGLSFDEVARRLRYVNFICPPGKCYNYQNVTYSLIGKIIAKKTGKTYEQYVTEKILNPLGMRTASVGFAGFTANNNYALPHVPARKGLMAVTVNENYYRVNPAAGVNASITDMSRWVLAQMGHNPEVLSPALLSAVHAKVTRNTPAQNHYGSREGVTDSHYGLGWRVFDYRGDKNFIHHGGGVMGFRSEVVFNPDLQIGMVVLTNTQRLSGEVIFEFLDAYEDEKNGVRRNVPSRPSAKKKK